MERDSSNQVYEDLRTARITYVPATCRPTTCDWSGRDVIRIQAYKHNKDESRSLHSGAEIPIENGADFALLIATLCNVYRNGVQPPS